MLEASICASGALPSALKPMVALYGLSRLQADLPLLLTEHVLPLEAGAAIGHEIRELCTELAPTSQRYVDAFGIPKHLVAAPIAASWERFNEVDNVGEVIGRSF